MSFARRLLKRALRRPPDEALSTIELIGIVVVTGILATLAVFGIGSLIDDAEQNVAESNLNTVVSGIQSIGSERLDTGGFSYSGSGTVYTAEQMINTLRERISNVNFAVMPAAAVPGTLATAGNIWADGTTPADPSIAYVSVNDNAYANGDGLDIPAGHLARVVVQASTETTLCAILVRSTESAGVGYDSWTTKGTGDTDPDWRALCLPAATGITAITNALSAGSGAANTVNGGPPRGAVTVGTGTSDDVRIARAPELATTPNAVGAGIIENQVFMDNFFATLPDPGRDDIEG